MSDRCENSVPGFHPYSFDICCAGTYKQRLGQTSYRLRTFVSQNLGIQFQYPDLWGEAMNSHSFDCHKFGCFIIQNQTRVNSNHDAWQMELSLKSQKEATQKLLVWTIDGNTGYRIQYSAPAHRFTEYLAGFEDMLRSFTFPEQSEERNPTCLLFNKICL